jgi:hypothetical protein
MVQRRLGEALVLGALLAVGLVGAGAMLAGGLAKFKSLDRVVSVKGLSEREVPADIAIWPIRFSEADNDLARLYATLESKNAAIVEYLKSAGFEASEIGTSVPAIQDRLAQGYAGERVSFRYAGTSTITVYTGRVDAVLAARIGLYDLGRKGIAVAGSDYEARTEFLFTKLNEIKPAMIEEATRNARQVAEKFAQDSDSRLGKIRSANQGQFSIDDRDSNTPHVKRVRVVSTVEYYLAD